MAEQPTSRKTRRRRSAVKQELDQTVAVSGGKLDQVKGHQVADGPAGVVAEDFPPESQPSAGVVPGAASTVPGAMLGGINPDFIEIMGPQRASDLIAEHGPWVLIEPQFNSLFVPDYARGPQSRMIGDILHRYYKPRRISAKVFDPHSRRKLSASLRLGVCQQLHVGS